MKNYKFNIEFYKFPYKKENYLKSLLYLFLPFLIISCTPPKNWRSSPYLKWQGVSNSQKSIRVKLYKGSPIAVSFPKSFTFKTEKGSFKKDLKKFLPQESGELISSKNIFKLKKKVYPGQLKIIKKNKTFLYINIVPLEDYLISVIGHEMSPLWPKESLKSQAIISRTYAYQKMNSAKNKLYDLDATTTNQVYGGLIIKDREKLEKPVIETRSQVLTYRGELAHSFFHSSCGGRTSNASEIWKIDYPYLKSFKSPYCKGTSNYSWKIKILLSKLSKKLRLSKIRKAWVVERFSSKRVKTVAIQTSHGVKKFTGASFRRKIGMQKVKSILFGLRIRKKFLEISGRGYGHGVGLCQWGARSLAEKHSKGYRYILNHYFPNTNISSKVF